MQNSDEKNDFQTVTVRIPKKLYAEYKAALFDRSAIVSYDLRNYMSEVVENSRKEK